MSDAIIAAAIIVSSGNLRLLCCWFKNLWARHDLPQQQPDCDGGKKDIEQRESDERHDETRYRRDCFSRPRHARAFVRNSADAKRSTLFGGKLALHRGELYR